MSSLARLLEYDHWANGEALSSVERAGTASPKPLQLMNHVLATEAGWLRRMGHRTDFDGFWPGDTLAELRTAWRDRLPAWWESFLADPALGDPARVVTYTNSKGETWKSAVEDIVLHVVIHSAYHRGQIAAQVRAVDGEPAFTDFIHATRAGIVR